MHGSEWRRRRRRKSILRLYPPLRAVKSDQGAWQITYWRGVDLSEISESLALSVSRSQHGTLYAAKSMHSPLVEAGVLQVILRMTFLTAPPHPKRSPGLRVRDDLDDPFHPGYHTSSSISSRQSPPVGTTGYPTGRRSARCRVNLQPCLARYYELR
jgi:hypothetical protein